MKKFGFGRSALSLALIVVALTACGKDSPQNSSSGQSPTPQGAGQSLDGSGSDWKQIKTFAQSIDGVSLNYDAKSKVADLNFNFRDIDVIGDDGTPVYTYISDLKGQVGPDGTATLSNNQVPDYSAKLKCQDKDCLSAKLEIRKATGKIAGIADVLQMTLVNTNIITGGDSGKARENPDTTQARVLKFLNSDDSRSVNLTITRVFGSRNQALKSFFKLRIAFENASSGPQNGDDITVREVDIAGKAGKNVLVHLGYDSLLGDVQMVTTTPYHADVDFDARHSTVSVVFHESIASGDTEADLVVKAGRELFASGSQRRR